MEGKRTIDVCGWGHPCRGFKRDTCDCSRSVFIGPWCGYSRGSLQEVARNGLTEDVGLLVNSSRGIIYASQGDDFAESARQAAHSLQKEMALLLKEKNLIEC